MMVCFKSIRCIISCWTCAFLVLVFGYVPSAIIHSFVLPEFEFSLRKPTLCFFYIIILLFYSALDTNWRDNSYFYYRSAFNFCIIYGRTFFVSTLIQFHFMPATKQLWPNKHQILMIISILFENYSETQLMEAFIGAIKRFKEKEK